MGHLLLLSRWPSAHVSAPRLNQAIAAVPCRGWRSTYAWVHLQCIVDRRTLDELLDVLLQLQPVRDRHSVQKVGELEELIGQVRVPRLVEAAVLSQAPRHRPQDRVG